MSSINRPRTIVLIVICLLIVAGAGVFTANYIFNNKASVSETLTVLEPARPLPELSLIDDTSQPFGLANLRGGWSLLFFGFTHCPDICPNTLGLLNAVHAQLKQNDDTPALKIIFVSVDPRRDTPEALHQYVRYFDKDFVGITGKITEITKLTQALYLPFGYTNNPGGGYTVEHSSTLVLINPQTQAKVYFTPPHEPQQLAADLAAVMQSR